MTVPPFPKTLTENRMVVNTQHAYLYIHCCLSKLPITKLTFVPSPGTELIVSLSSKIFARQTETALFGAPIRHRIRIETFAVIPARKPHFRRAASDSHVRFGCARILNDFVDRFLRDAVKIYIRVLREKAFNRINLNRGRF